MATSVLLVDDSEITRCLTSDVLLEVFGAKPVEIVEAEDGKQALAAIETRRFDVILLDLTMPEVDGYAVLKQLREMGNPAKVIVTSADMQGGAQQRAFDLGAFAFITKPALAGELSKHLIACGVL